MSGSSPVYSRPLSSCVWRPTTASSASSWSDLTVDGCITKAPCGGEAAGKSPVDRGKQGTKRSLLVEATGIPLGCVVTGAHRNDSPLLRPTLEKLGRFETATGIGIGVGLPEEITVHLDAGYDSTKTRNLLQELGCRGVISEKGFPLQAGARWVIERTNSWHNRGFKKLATCTERRTRVIEAFIALANAVIIVRRLTRRSLAHPPLGQPPDPATMTYPRDLLEVVSHLSLTHRAVPTAISMLGFLWSMPQRRRATRKTNLTLTCLVFSSAGHYARAAVLRSPQGRCKHVAP